jgi:hypothetical protein
MYRTQHRPCLGPPRVHRNLSNICAVITQMPHQRQHSLTAWNFWEKLLGRQAFDCESWRATSAASCNALSMWSAYLTTMHGKPFVRMSTKYGDQGFLPSRAVWGCLEAMQASDECSDSADPVAPEPMSSGTLCAKRPDVAYDRNPTAALRERLSELIYPLGAGTSPSCVLVLDLQRVQRKHIVADKLGGNQLWIWGLLGIWVCSRQCHCCNPRGMIANICISTIPGVPNGRAAIKQ